MQSGLLHFRSRFRANAGNGSEVGAGLVGFGIGAVVGSAPSTATGLCRPTATCLLRATVARLCRATAASLCRATAASLCRGRFSMGVRHIATIAAKDTMREMVGNIVTMGNAVYPTPTVGGPLAPACY